MADNNKSSSALILEASDGNKYALNPFSSAVSINKMSSPRKYQIQITHYCPHCNLTFNNLQQYEHHNLELHGQRKTLTCDICTATFKRHDHLKRHMQSLHTNQRNCTCPVCGKDLRRQDALIRHIKGKHYGGNEIFRCRVCDFQCPSHMELEKHEFIHNVERHVCTHCSTTFKRRDHMLRHVKSQHLNEFVVCPICSCTYKRKDHLVRHMREKHRMGYIDGKLVKSSDLL